MSEGDADAVESFGRWIEARLGSRLERDDDLLERVLEERVRASGAGSAASYVALLAVPSRARDELRAIAPRFTVGESYFFRNPELLEAFAALHLAPPASPPRERRFLSAGCASGEEPYTLAILALERGAPDARVTAIDVNAASLERARRARYSTWALRQTHELIRSRYFSVAGRELVLAEAARSRVDFLERNLVDDDPVLYAPGSYDAIFFRNVLIYLTPEAARAVVARLAAALVPGGHLFLGDAETLRGISDELALRQSHGAFFYERAGQRDTAPREAALPNDATWVDAIQRSSDRIARLASPPQVEPEAAPPIAPSGAWDRAPVLELVKQERYALALAWLEDAPPEARDDPFVQLLRAALLTNEGRVAEAEALCDRVLALDARSAGAHYLLALCREHAGDRAAAREHDRAATALAPTFAMPHLHLGLLARRSGDAKGARAALESARDLLSHEDPSRLLLFGGGFDREALKELVRAELRACELRSGSGAS